MYYVIGRRRKILERLLLRKRVVYQSPNNDRLIESTGRREEEQGLSISLTFIWEHRFTNPTYYLWPLPKFSPCIDA